MPTILDQMREPFSVLIIQHIPLTENAKVDRLAKMVGALNQSVSSNVMGKELVSQVDLPEENTNDFKDGDWMYDIYQYLYSGRLPKESKRRTKVKVRSMRFFVQSDLV